MKCSICSKPFNTKNSKGCKLVPVPLCPNCARDQTVVNCPECQKSFRNKDGWRDECFECEKKLCFFCVGKSVKYSELEFNFCKQHINYDEDWLKIEANRIKEEYSDNEIQQTKIL